MKTNQNVIALALFIHKFNEAATPTVLSIVNLANVSLVQLSCLRFLASQGNPNRGTKMTDVARWARRSTAAATGLIDRIEKLGLVERSSNPSDRRKVFVEITPKGLELLSRVDEALVAFITENFGDALDELVLPGGFLRMLSHAA